MTAYIVGFICALILSAFLVAWIAYCMFCKERHKSESYQYNISDLKHQNYEFAQEQQEKNTKEGITAGIFILPSRHKKKEDFTYEKRPDYPEGTVKDLQPKTDRLIEIFNESPDDKESRKCVGFDVIDCDVPYHSEV